MGLLDKKTLIKCKEKNWRCCRKWLGRPGFLPGTARGKERREPGTAKGKKRLRRE